MKKKIDIERLTPEELRTYLALGRIAFRMEGWRCIAIGLMIFIMGEQLILWQPSPQYHWYNFVFDAGGVLFLVRGIYKLSLAYIGKRARL